MLKYIFNRILLFLPTLFFITLISFSISRLAPGDPAELKAGIAGGDGAMSGNSGLNAKIIEQVREQWHLDKPVFLISLFDDTGKQAPQPWWQRLTFRWNGMENQYFIWMGQLLRLDFGISFRDNRPVVEKIMERVPVTLSMNIASLILAYLIAVPLGIYSATHPGTFFDRLSTFFLFALYSLPVFWMGTLAVTFLCSEEFIRIFPSSGLHSMNFSEDWPLWEKLLDYSYYLLLPMLIYTYGSFAFISRQMRSAMLENLRQDYVRTARAKGVPERTVIFRHVLRNSLIPLITLLAGILPGLIGGSVIVEKIFNIPGMGQLSFEALNYRDYPTVMAVFTISAVLTLAGILVSDILYSIADPRIGYGKKS